MDSKGIFGRCRLPAVPVFLTFFSATAIASEVSVEAHSHQTRFFGLESPTQTIGASGTLGDPSVAAETLVTSDGLRFFTRTAGPPEPVFSSALARGDSFYGVGASGITGMSTNDVAEARVSYTFQNPIGTQIDLSSVVHVEPIEVLAWVLSSSGGTQEFGPISVLARLKQTYTVIHADGTRDAEFDVYDMSLSVRRNDATGRFERIFSDDFSILFGEVNAAGEFLVNAPAVDEIVNGNRVFGSRIDPFDVEWFVTTLEPGESVELNFLAQAMVNRQAETGGQAFIGDPFSLDFPSTPNLSVAYAPTIPLPPSGPMFLAALALVLRKGVKKAMSPLSVGFGAPRAGKPAG